MVVRGADPDAVGAVGPLLVRVRVVHVVDDARAAAPPQVLLQVVAAAAAPAVDEGAQGPVEALGQEAALGIEYAARS